MGRLSMFVLCLVLAPVPAAQAQRLDDFKIFSRAIGKEVSVVDHYGLIRDGIVETASADQITLRVGSATLLIPCAEIASADRMKDESSDGAVKGALWALLLSLLPNQGYTNAGDAWRSAGTAIVLFSAVGYLLDAGNTTSQPLYRARSGATPTVNFSWRF